MPTLHCSIAIETLVKYKVIATIAAADSVAATSVGVVGGAVMLDLAYEEDSRADVDMNIVMTGAGKFVELQATSEKRCFRGRASGRDAGRWKCGCDPVAHSAKEALAGRT